MLLADHWRDDQHCIHVSSRSHDHDDEFSDVVNHDKYGNQQALDGDDNDDDNHNVDYEVHISDKLVNRNNFYHDDCRGHVGGNVYMPCVCE